jgi:hypothetical protein
MECLLSENGVSRLREIFFVTGVGRATAHYVVIPAQAGIQCHFTPSFPRKRESSAIQLRCISSKQFVKDVLFCWIPACAGMTEETKYALGDN